MLDQHKTIDDVISAITDGRVTGKNISAANIRHVGRKDLGLHDQLDYGRKIPETVEELDQYLYSYAPMVSNQWEDIAKSIDMIVGEKFGLPTSIVDYGCGQGLAIAKLFDGLPEFRSHVKNVTLVEPSDVALDRAAAIVSCYLDDKSKVKPVLRTLDKVGLCDLPKSDGKILHLFSNVLDVSQVHALPTFEAIMSMGGQHFLLIVSHHRDKDGGTPHVEKLLQEAENIANSRSLRFEPEDYQLTTTNSRGHEVEHNFWYVEIEVINGSF